MGIFKTLIIRQPLVIVAQDGNDTELLKIHVATGVVHGFSAKATKFNVENGANISDHIIKNPVTLSITGIISDDPYSYNLATRYVAGNLRGAIGAIGGPAVDVVSAGAAAIGSKLLESSEGRPSKTAKEAMTAIYNGGIPVTLITGLDTYTNMALTNYSNEETSKKASGLHFKAKFEQLNIVQSEVAKIPLESVDSDAEGAVGKTKQGRKTPEEVTGKANEKASSLLFKIKEAF